MKERFFLQAFCEITVEHREPIKANVLAAMIRSFGNTIPLSEAYARSSFYRLRPPRASILAFELGNCFVILRKVSNVRCSIYHLEGSSITVSVGTMLQSVQELSKELARQLGRKALISSDYKVRNLTARLFEDNGREAAIDGKPITIGSIFREKFAWREMVSPVTTFATALFLIWRRLSTEPAAAAFYSIVIVVVLTFTTWLQNIGQTMVE